MSDKHHKSSFTDILFFVAIIAVVVLVLAGNSQSFRNFAKAITRFFR